MCVVVSTLKGMGEMKDMAGITHMDHHYQKSTTALLHTCRSSPVTCQ